jgi:hypothetical protein
MVLLAAFLAFALAGLLAFVIVEGREDGSSAAPAPRAVHHYPQHWNHRIAPLARIVARQRGLHFEHPVAVRFLSASAFGKSLDAEGRTTSREDRRQAAQAAGMMRALGLLSGQVSLIHAVHDANGAEVLAYYSFHDKRITVRGRDLTPSVKVTLVHELTHVLQDQHFRIGPRLRRLQQAKGPSTTAYDVLDAIVEGDADRMASEYRRSLPASQRRAVAATDGLERRHARHGLATVPSFVTASLEAPYALGLALTEGDASGSGGNAAVDQLLRHPPTHDVVLLDPLRVLEGATGAVRVPDPELKPGDKRQSHGELGAVSWYLMLAARVPAAQALDAADGWGGDAYVAYRHAGRTCVRMTFAGRTGTDAGQMYSTLQQWAADGPVGSTVSLAAGRAHVRSCDPGTGTGTHTGDTRSLPALRTAAVRDGFSLGLARAGASLPVARCAETSILDHATVAELSSVTLSRLPAVRARIRQAVSDCA